MNSHNERDLNNEREVNQEAFRRLKGTIQHDYPPGRFLAIYQGEIAGEAADFMELRRLLQASGKDPNRALIAQTGIDYPDYAIIF